jgi:hypothetical protein
VLHQVGVSFDLVLSRFANVRFTTIHFYDTCPVGPSTLPTCDASPSQLKHPFCTQCASSSVPVCMCFRCVCVSGVHVFPVCMCFRCACVSCVHVSPVCIVPVCMCFWRACVSGVHVFLACMCFWCPCVSGVHVFLVCMCFRCACVSGVHVFPVCMCFWLVVNINSLKVPKIKKNFTI